MTARGGGTTVDRARPKGDRPPEGAHLVLFKPVHPTEIVRRLPQLDLDESAWITPTLARAEWEHIQRVLLDCNGNVSGAARRLGILRQSLQRRLRKARSAGVRCWSRGDPRPGLVCTSGFGELAQAVR